MHTGQVGPFAQQCGEVTGPRGRPTLRGSDQENPIDSDSTQSATAATTGFLTFPP